MTSTVTLSLKDELIMLMPAQCGSYPIPLLIYFFVLFFISVCMGKRIAADYAKTASIAFTAGGNNFELAIVGGDGDLWHKLRTGVCHHHLLTGGGAGLISLVNAAFILVT